MTTSDRANQPAPRAEAERNELAEQAAAIQRSPAFDGMAARDRGELVDACPHEPGPQRTAWVIGWYIAGDV